MLLVIVPVLLPSVAALGIDAVYFGVIIVFNITIGLVTPPYRLLLFLLAALALLVVFPALVMWLPRLLGYAK